MLYRKLNKKSNGPKTQNCQKQTIQNSKQRKPQNLAENRKTPGKGKTPRRNQRIPKKVSTDQKPGRRKRRTDHDQQSISQPRDSKIPALHHRLSSEAATARKICGNRTEIGFENEEGGQN
jgi:hypothetical protein